MTRSGFVFVFEIASADFISLPPHEEADRRNDR